MRFLSLCSILLFLLILGNMASAQPDLRYIFPDVGAAGMNTYVEIVAAHDARFRFGVDGIYLNRPTDAFNVQPIGLFADKIIVGPLVVSWDGRLISTQIYVKPGIPNTGGAQLQVTTPDGSSNLTFNVVIPAPLTLTAGGPIGGDGVYGRRSERGAMIVSSLSIASGGTYTVSTTDYGFLAGNQGYLPFIIIAQNGVNLGPVTIDVSGNGRNGGPGGGGGGGEVCDAPGGRNGTTGGDGYTGGGGGGQNAASFGNSTPQNHGSGSGGGGGGLSGVPVALGSAECTNPEGAGGGTGHPFGRSGENFCAGSTGGYGGAATGGQTGGLTGVGSSGGGGGYSADGSNGTGSGTSSTAGKRHGNAQLVPFAGGSGGAAGNPRSFGNCGGYGGGGGGAIAIYSMGQMNTQATILANGASGGAGYSTIAGGGGSGGAIMLGAKVQGGSTASAGVYQVAGGSAGTNGSGNGSVGRARYDGFTANPPTFTAGASSSIGPTTDTLTYSQSIIPLSGTRDPSSQIVVYMRSETGNWVPQGTPTYNGRRWNLDLLANDGTGYYYIAAFQQVNGALSNAPYDAVPTYISSQVAANIVKVDALPMIDPIPSTNFGNFGNTGFCLNADTAIVFYFRSIGSDSLRVRTQIVNESTPGIFTVVSPAGLATPGGLAYKPQGFSDTIPVLVRAAGVPGTHTAKLLIISNDPRDNFDTVVVDLATRKQLAELTFSKTTIDFGKVCLGSKVVDSAMALFRGNSQAFQIESLSSLLATSPYRRIRPVATPISFRDPMDQIIRDSAALVFEFAPRNPGPFFDSVVITDGCKNRYVVYLRGEGVQVKLDVIAPASATAGNLQFPRTVVNRSFSQVITIQNNGQSAMTLDNPSITPADNIYRITNPASLKGIVLQPGETLDITIEFLPTDTLNYIATLQLNVEGPCNTVDPLQLRGQGVNVCLSSSIVDVTLIADSCSIDPEPVLQQVTLRNCGGVVVDLLEWFSVNNKVTTDLTLQSLTTQSETSRTRTFTISWDPASGTGTDSIGIVWREKDATLQDTLWIAVTLKFDRAVVQLQTVAGDPVPDSLHIGSVYQCGPAQDTIILVNAGTVEGDITGSFEKGGIFRVSPLPPYNLAIDEKKQLIITLDPANAPNVGETYEDVLVLFNGRCNQEWRVKLSATRRQLEVDVTPSPVNFGATNLGLPRSATVQLTNNTNALPSEELVIDNIYIDPPSASPTFEIVTTPTFPAQVQAAGGTLPVDLTFTPDQEQVYTGKLCFQISEPCDTLICVDLRGEGIRSNIYVPQSNLDFGKVYYCEEDTLSLTIFSVGPVDLTVNDIRLVGGDLPGFEIISVSKTLATTLQRGVPQIVDSIDVLVRFIPANVAPDGVKSTTLEIESDDPRQGLMQIPVTGTRTSPQVVGPALVSYGTVVVSGSSTLPVTLTNTSEDTITILNPRVSAPFRLLTPTPLVIPPNSSIDVRVEFTPTGSQVYNDTLVGLFSLPCDGEMRVPLTGEGLQGETLISIPKTVAGEPGEEILIPIVLEESQAIADVGATTLQIDLRFNGSMLLPVDVQFTNGTAKATATSGSIVSNRLVGDDRVVRVELKNDPLPAAPDTLGWMKAVVLLGNDVATPIVLENPEWIDGEVVTSTEDGEFTLQGYCAVGGDRLIRVEGLFGIKTVAPNPFSNVTEIEFETVENGKTSLEVYDIFGRKVATLLDVADLSVQAHVATWDAEPQPAGIYFAVLTTPTQRSVKRMVVVK
ncbi:MAG: choice-of-anchor D domain-containing protein [Candidatus Kapaibacterium sp.]